MHTYLTLPCFALQYIALVYVALHYIIPRFTPLRYTTVQYIAAVHGITLSMCYSGGNVLMVRM